MRKFIAYILFAVVSLSSFGQYSFDKEKNKYWIYRERLKTLMVSGNCKGCDIPAGSRSNDDGILSWADSPWMIGYWIGTLAMEYKLLTDAGLSSASPEVMKTKEDLYNAIQSINRLDWEAEQSWGCSHCGNNSVGPCPGNINGFLLNDDAPSDFSQVLSIIDGLNEGLVPPPDGCRDKCISSAYTEYLTPGREASLDHLIGLYIGLSLVKKCIPEYETWNTPFINASSEASNSSFVAEVKIISQRIINYLSSSGWTYMNPCANRCVLGDINPINPNACNQPGPPKTCLSSSVPTPDCCAKGGALAQPEAIGFAAANQFIQGNPDPIFISLVMNPLYWAAWNAALNNAMNPSNNNRLPLTLAAIGNIWKVGFGFVNVVVGHVCVPPVDLLPTWVCGGACWCTQCCLVDQDVIVPVPVIFSSTTAQVSSHLVNAGKNNNWEHLYLLHKLLHTDGGNTTNIISNPYYECLLNAAPCRGFDGQSNGSAQNIEWGHSDRLDGGRATGPSEPAYGGWGGGGNNGTGYMFYFNLYNLNNPQSGYPYAPIPIKQLAPDNVVKPGAYINTTLQPYQEWDKKNIIAAQTITAHDYEVTVSQFQEQGRVTFAAGQKITLGDGFKVTNGGYFHGYIDPAIGAMNCSDPPSQTDCSGEYKLTGPAEPDTITDLDSVIVMLAPDTLTNTLPCPVDTLYPHAKYLDSDATSFYWDFGNGQTSSLENPSIYYSSSGNYLLTLITTSPSNTDTNSVLIIVPDCNNLRTNNQNKQPSANPTKELEKRIKIIPNPSSGIFTLQLSENTPSQVFIYNPLGQVVFKSLILNPQSLINLSSHPSGIYFIKVQTADKIYTEKII